MDEKSVNKILLKFSSISYSELSKYTLKTKKEIILNAAVSAFKKDRKKAEESLEQALNKKDEVLKESVEAALFGVIVVCFSILGVALVFAIKQAIKEAKERQAWIDFAYSINSTMYLNEIIAKFGRPASSLELDKKKILYKWKYYSGSHYHSGNAGIGIGSTYDIIVNVIVDENSSKVQSSNVEDNSYTTFSYSY